MYELSIEGACGNAGLAVDSMPTGHSVRGYADRQSVRSGAGFALLD